MEATGPTSAIPSMSEGAAGGKVVARTEPNAGALQDRWWRHMRSVSGYPLVRSA